MPGAGTYSYSSAGLAANYTNYTGDCSPYGKSASGIDMVFAVNVPAGQTLTAVMTPAPSADAVLLLAASCVNPVTSCLAVADEHISGDAETLVYTNQTGVSETRYLIADHYGTYGAGAITLDVSIDPPKPGELCVSAIPVTTSGTLYGSFDTAANDYDPGYTGCTGHAEPGPDIVYAVSLAAGQTVHVTLTPSGLTDVALYAVTDCTHLSTSCVAADDNSYSGSAESIGFTATAATTLYVIVDGFSAYTSGAYSISFAL